MGKKEIGDRSQNHSGMCRLWKTLHKVPRTDGCNPKTKASVEKSLEQYMNGPHLLKRNLTQGKNCEDSAKREGDMVRAMKCGEGPTQPTYHHHPSLPSGGFFFVPPFWGVFFLPPFWWIFFCPPHFGGCFFAVPLLVFFFVALRFCFCCLPGVFRCPSEVFLFCHPSEVFFFALPSPLPPPQGGLFFAAPRVCFFFLLLVFFLLPLGVFFSATPRKCLFLLSPPPSLPRGVVFFLLPRVCVFFCSSFFFAAPRVSLSAAPREVFSFAAPWFFFLLPLGVFLSAPSGVGVVSLLTLG